MGVELIATKLQDPGFRKRTDVNTRARLTAVIDRSVLMRRLSPEERKHILHHTLVRMQKDWVCRYGRWNTVKLLGELRRLLRRVNQPGGLEALGAPEPVATAMEEELPLFDQQSA